MRLDEESLHGCCWLKAVRFGCTLSTLAALLGACAVAPGAGLLAQETSAEAVAAETPETSAPQDGSLPDGLFTRGQASRGERRFGQMCLACHRPNEITRVWFQGTIHQTVGDLFAVISTTMPEGNPGSLTSEEYVDILAFMLRLNDYPAGEAELPADRSLLEKIRIPAL